MTAYLSLLRAINVAGKNRISMAELKELYQTLGGTEVATYIQSGNVVFNYPTKTTELALAQKISTAIKTTFQYDLEIVVYTKKTLTSILNENPFLKQTQDPSNLYLTLFNHTKKLPITEELHSRFKQCLKPGEKLHIGSSAIYLYCPQTAGDGSGGYGRTKLNNAFFEKSLGIPATTRNWKTLQVLKGMLEKIN